MPTATPLPPKPPRRQRRRLLTGLIGFTILALGVVLFVLPTPVGLIVLAFGLLVLATEFAWARSWMGRIKRNTGKVGERSIGEAEGWLQRWKTRLGLADELPRKPPQPPHDDHSRAA